MKYCNFFKSFLIICLAVVNLSCSSDDSSNRLIEYPTNNHLTIKQNRDNSILEVVNSTEFKNIENIIIKNKDLIDEISIRKQELKSISIHNIDVKNIKKVLEEISKSNSNFIDYLEFNKLDITEIFGKEKISEEEIASLNFITVLITKELYTNSYRTQQLRGGSFGGCLSEALGIAAGANLISNLAEGAVGRQFIKSAVKFAISKIGLRAVSGVGLALIAAEVAYCMY